MCEAFHAQPWELAERWTDEQLVLAIDALLDSAEALEAAAGGDAGRRAERVGERDFLSFMLN